MGFIGQLLSFLSSFYGIVFIGLLLFLITKINRDIRYLWILLVLLLYFSSLAKFRDQWTEEPPALVPFLQILRENGRPLAVLTLIGLLIGINQNKYALMQNNTLIGNSSIKFLLFVQIVIFIKVSMAGNNTFALIALTTFISIVYCFQKGINKLISIPNGFALAVLSIIAASVIFLITNMYQGYFDMHPITFVQGRFLGTTGNPQHAAVLLASTIPAYMYLISKYKPSLKMVFIYIFLIFTLYGMILTGSRTGLLMSFIIIILFIYKGSPLLSTITILSFIFILLFIDEITLFISLSTDSNEVINRLSSTEDTRSAAWKGMWESFTFNPIFGIPIKGDRIGFGENSWLATASSLGLMGLIPLLFFGIKVLNNSIKTLRVSLQKKTSNYLEYKFVSTGIISLLVGSFFEAYLLGNLTFSLLILFLYISMQEFLITSENLNKNE